MYVFVIVDKLNHCTAFKPKVSPWDNKYTHADIQVGLSVSHRDSLCVPVEEVLRFQGFKRIIRKLSGTKEDARPFWRFRDRKTKRRRILLWQHFDCRFSNFQSRDPWTEPGSKVSFHVFFPHHTKLDLMWSVWLRPAFSTSCSECRAFVAVYAEYPAALEVVTLFKFLRSCRRFLQLKKDSCLI